MRKLPKPRISTLSSLDRASLMLSSTVFTTASTSFRVNPGQVAGKLDAHRKVAHLVNEFQLKRLSAGEDTAVRDRPHLRYGQAASGCHGFDKLALHIVYHALKQFSFPFGDVSEGGADVLVLARLDDDLLHADLVKELFQVRRFHLYADSSGQRAGVGHDLVRRGGDIVSARRRARPHGGNDLFPFLLRVHKRIVDLL